MEKTPSNKTPSIRTLFFGAGIFVAVFVALGTASVAGWEYTNSDTFCATACHAVHPEEPFAHQAGHHANVACVECHIGRVSTFEALIEKSGHVTHAWSFIFGYERPTHAPSFKGSGDSCEGCHTNEPHRHNVVITKKRFSDDRRNTESKLTLSMRLNGREFAEEERRDVNWHASGAVRFIADDPQNLDIRWVEMTLPDGSRQVYNDVTNALTEAEVAAAEIKTMDCGDCHNRAGHAFRGPEEEVDAALEDGRLDPGLPFIKRRMIELLGQDFDSEEEAEALIESAWQAYQEEFPDLQDSNPEAWQRANEFTSERQEFLMALLQNSRFQDEGISWRSFPDHNGHKLDPGCFRCHSGSLQMADGKPIPVNCTGCHSIPLITRRDRLPDYFLSLIDKQKPETHRDPAFISRHMDLAGEECTVCHDAIRFGVNDRSYCSNSGCHGEVWEFLDLDALRTTD